MDLHLDSDDVGFLDDVRAAIRLHWPPAVRRPRALLAGHEEVESAAAQAWFAALVARGWSVPHWPREHGGTGWSAARRYLWARETALAEVPELDPCGVDLVGPLLWTLGSAAQQRHLLAAIREARVRCCCGWAEPDAGSDLSRVATRAVRVGGHYRLDGTKLWVAGAARAEWMLCLARTSEEPGDPERGLSLFLVDMSLPGLQLASTTTLDGSQDLASVTLDAVRVPDSALLGPPGGALAALAGLDHAGSIGRVLAIRLQVHAERLKTLARETPAGATALADDGDFSRKMAALEVAVAALEGLELRALAEQERAVASPGVVPGRSPAMASMLRIRRAAAAQRLGELYVEALGYYGLPFPDALLIDNEGPIGHDYALSEMRDMLRGRSWSIDGGTSETHKNRIARTILGF